MATYGSRPSVVVDASVAVKWLLPEDGQDHALSILHAYQDERLDVVAPHLFVGEVGNVLWKWVVRRRLTGQQAQRCFDRLLIVSPILVHSPDVSRSALELAVRHRQTVYDCLYLTTALSEKCDFVTADLKFYGAMRTAFPCVRPLASFEVSD